MSNNIINTYVDTFEECAIQYYNDCYLDEGLKIEGLYFISLTKIINYFLEKDEMILLRDEYSPKTISLTTLNSIEDKLDVLYDLEISIEDVRQSILLLSISALKHANLKLDSITPDATSMIMTTLSSAVLNKVKHPLIMDPNIGVGNLAFILNNYLNKQFSMIGIEKKTYIAQYLASCSNLLHFNLTIYNEDALKFVYPDVDLVISDIDSYYFKEEDMDEEEYFPYHLIIKHLDTGSLSTQYIYLVDSNFFSQKHAQVFKKELEKKASIKAIITLPPNFFKDLEKIIIVITKKQIKKVQIYNLPNIMVDDINNKEPFLETLNNIKQYLEE